MNDLRKEDIIDLLIKRDIEFDIVIDARKKERILIPYKSALTKCYSIFYFLKFYEDYIVNFRFKDDFLVILLKN